MLELARRRAHLSAPRLAAGLALLVLTVNLSCTRGPETGPGTIRVDRDVCSQCAMVISEPLHAAQVRGKDSSDRSQLHFFDDLGCAVLFLERKGWCEQPSSEFWVAHHETGSWLPARKASYVLGVRSPMDFGLGATDEPLPGSLSYDDLKPHVQRVQDNRGRRMNPGGALP